MGEGDHKNKSLVFLPLPLPFSDMGGWVGGWAGGGGVGGGRGSYRLVGAKHDCGADHGEGRADEEPEAARQVDEP